MNSVKTILKGKSSTYWAIQPHAKVIDALRLMADKNVGALMVMDSDQLVGIISERDYARKVALMGKTSVDTPVSDIMESPVWTVTTQQTREDCMALMTAKRIRHLPVVDNGHVVNILSIGDLVKDALSEQAQTIQQLESYVNS
ncbi:MAG: CBS domain-containing protein [Betaproteobacteria bacterium]|nr:CBS domain-containing protein [Betaproteobacteria bacterium]MDE2622603.1 CBS domain-containing protein [Betaproteobacteria bacterium]